MSEPVELQPRSLYPFRRADRPGPLQAATAAALIFGARMLRRSGAVRQESHLARLAELFRELRDLSPDALRAARSELRRRGGEMVFAVALAGEAFRRNGGLEPLGEQWLAAWDMAHGRLASLPAGGGKSGAVAIAAAALAASGTPVHVVAASDRNAVRDHRRFSGVFQALGLSVGVAAEGMEPEVRRAAYRCDVTYVTPRQVIADHLSDRIVLRGRGGNLRLKTGQMHAGTTAGPAMMMRGLHAALVDDADDVLIDGARSPVTVSGPRPDAPESRIAVDAVRVARALVEGRDFEPLCAGANEISLTDAGRARVEVLTKGMGGLWRGAARRERFVAAALAVLHGMERGRHYGCEDGQIRVAPALAQNPLAQRYWSYGMLQMTEIKEGLPPSATTVPLAQLTIPGFFARYALLGAVSAVARPIAGELRRRYSMAWLGESPATSGRRRRARWLICRDTEAKLDLLLARVREHRAAGRPVLIGTPTEERVAVIVSVLEAAGIGCEILAASPEVEERMRPLGTVAPGAVSIVVGDALRGASPHIPAGVRASGGPACLLAGLHEAPHKDALFLTLAGCDETGRASAEFILALDEPELGRARYAAVARVIRRFPAGLAGACGRLLFAAAQRSRAAAHSRVRRSVVDADDRRRRLLAFAGSGE